jgi:hypothetical protein
MQPLFNPRRESRRPLASVEFPLHSQLRLTSLPKPFIIYGYIHQSGTASEDEGQEEKWSGSNEYKSHFFIKSSVSRIHRNVCGNSFISQ